MDYESWRIQQQIKANDILDTCAEIVRGLKADLLGSMTLAQKYWEDTSCVGVVLSGPEGCGKHTLLSYILYNVRPGKTDAQCLFLDGNELSAEGLNGKTLCSFMGKYLDDCWDKYIYTIDENNHGTKGTSKSFKPLDSIVILENPEKYSHLKEFLHFWQKSACASYGEEECPRLFLVILSTNRVTLPYLLSCRMGNVVLTLPGLKFRQRFAENHAKSLLKTMSPQRIAELTDGMNCAQLKAAIEATDYLTADSALHRELLEEFLTGQKPILTAEERHMRFEEQLPQILEKMAEKGFAMPVQGVAVNNGNNNAASVQNANQVTGNTNEDTASAQSAERERLQAMSGQKLVVTIFGEDRVKNLNTAAQELNN